MELYHSAEKTAGNPRKFPLGGKKHRKLFLARRKSRGERGREAADKQGRPLLPPSLRSYLQDWGIINI